MHALVWTAALSVSAGGLLPAPPAAARDGPQPATIRVELPADAKLTVDGEPTRSMSAVRSFITPPLELGKTFHVTLKAEFVRGNKAWIVAEKVPLRAGRETNVSLNWPGSTGVAFASLGSNYDLPATESGSEQTRFYYLPPGGLGGESLMQSSRALPQRSAAILPEPRPMSEFSSMKGFGPPGFEHGYNP